MNTAGSFWKKREDILAKLRQHMLYESPQTGRAKQTCSEVNLNRDEYILVIPEHYGPYRTSSQTGKNQAGVAGGLCIIHEIERESNGYAGIYY